MNARALRARSFPRSPQFTSNPSSQTFPLSWLSNFFDGTRLNLTVTRSEVALNGMVNCCQYVVPTCFSEVWPSTSTNMPSLVEIASVFIQNESRYSRPFTVGTQWTSPL